MDTKPRALVVEDTVSWQENYREILDHSGFHVVTVEDLAAALDALTKQFFHIAIIDLELKGQSGNRDGREVIKLIWSLDEGTRYLVSTGKGDISMFNEFSTMGIFSFTEIPDIDQARMKEMEAYDGVIAKERDSLDKIHKDVESALDKSWRDYIKHQRKQSPFKVVKGFDPKNIQRSLRGGKNEELHPFLSALVRPLYPWLNSKSGSTEIRDASGEVIAFESICWSRALGHAVAIRFGKRDRYEESLKQIGIADGCGGSATELYRAPLEENAQQPFKGVVYKLDMDFDGNFDHPPIKRTSDSKAPQIKE